MATTVASYIQLTRLLEQRVSLALKMTQQEIYERIQEKISEYYKEPVFRGGSNQPVEYERTYKLLNSLIKTEIVSTSKGVSCKVEIDPNYLSYQYPGNGYSHASGQEVMEYANASSHGGTVNGDINVWDDAINDLGGRVGIDILMKANLKKCGVPVK